MNGVFHTGPAGGLTARAIPRPRLTGRLQARFDHRLTVVVGPAGAGKSTLLGLAVDANELDPLGQDVWLGAEALPDHPDLLLAGIGAALGLDVGDPAEALDQIVTELWQRAPTDVALIVDDAHVFASPESVAVLADLLRGLPRNAHLVLVSRRPPPLPLARLRAQGEVLDIRASELDLDDDEAEELARARGSETGPELPRHPALADLTLVAGRDVQLDYLREEVLSSVDDLQLEALIDASIVSEIDDEVALALSDGALDCAGLAAGVPLASAGGGRLRMHALLRDTLSQRLDPERRVKVARVVAELEEERGNHRRAVGLLASTGDRQRAIQVARRFLELSTIRRDYADLTFVRQFLLRAAPRSALARFLAYECDFEPGRRDTSFDQQVQELDAVIAQAEAEGDQVVETVAIYRSLEEYDLNAVAPPPERVERLTELAWTLPLAAEYLRYVRCRGATADGRPEDALAALASGGPVLDQAAEGVFRATRLCDLARPEEVGAELSPEDLAALPQGTETMIGFAMWLRGEASPELARAIAADMVSRTLPRRILTNSVSLLAVNAFVNLAAGRWESTAKTLERADRLSASGCPAAIRLLVDMAHAASASIDGDDGRATEILGASLERIPIAHWPDRGHLLSIPLLYLLRPEVRAVLDRCRFGPSFRTAVEAGRALAALEEGQVRPCETLPWESVDLLRVHVLPHHLTRLAVVAVDAGCTEAEAVLAAVPDLGRWLDRDLDHPNPVVAEATRRRMEATPLAPDHHVEIRTLGTFEVVIDGRPSEDEAWRRRRVRELLALLVELGAPSRDEIGRLLWPDLDADKRASNLRVNLGHLQRILEPDRPSRRQPYFVVADGEHVRLAPEVGIDVRQLDERLERARQVDAGGDPGAALIRYREALALHRGPYLPGLEPDWTESTRIRVDALTVSARCRIGELVAARGEPEEALESAEAALRINPLSERAARLAASALAAMGDRSAAVRALDAAARRVGDAGLTPETATTRLRERLCG